MAIITREIVPANICKPDLFVELHENVIRAKNEIEIQNVMSALPTNCLTSNRFWDSNVGWAEERSPTTSISLIVLGFINIQPNLQTKHPEGKEIPGATGGVQGYIGTLFGTPYKAGSWQDKLIESFAGTHDFICGQLPGLYDEQGNAIRGRNDAEKVLHETWSAAAIIPSAPFAMSDLLPPDVWQAISILLRNAK